MAASRKPLTSSTPFLKLVLNGRPDMSANTTLLTSARTGVVFRGSVPLRRTPAWPSATVRRPPHSNYECDIDSSCLRAHSKLPTRAQISYKIPVLSALALKPLRSHRQVRLQSTPRRPVANYLHKTDGMT